MKNIGLYAEFTKKLILFYLQSLIFHSKILKHCGTFFERGRNSLKRTNIERGISKSNRNEQGGNRVKNSKFQASVLFKCPLKN